MGDHYISGPGVRIREESIFFLSGCQIAAGSHLEEVVPEVIVASNPLTMGSTDYCMVTKLITGALAGWTGTI